MEGVKTYCFDDYSSHVLKPALTKSENITHARFSLPNMCFLTSSLPIEFCTDGTITRLDPADKNQASTNQILMLTWLHVGQLNLKSIPAISLFDTIDLPDTVHVPEVYDGSQMLHGRNILIMMLNGWGDMILIQPALRAFYEKGTATGIPPRITIAGNWMHNFPYPNVPYIHNVCPNILTLEELCTFDILVNLIAVNYQKSSLLSMGDMVLQLMKIDNDCGTRTQPVLYPDPSRVKKIRPVLDGLRKKTRKKLLAVNWKSRFSHKNAPPDLFFGIARALSHEYQAVLFKDEETSAIMQKEIEDLKLPIMNLSSLIQDYHDTTAALSLVDAFISVDTGIVHAAGAMGIPGVALFGPFPPETHVAEYSSIMGIRADHSGNKCSGPCLETHRGCMEVDYDPDRVSPCFGAIQVDRVVQGLKNITNRYPNPDKPDIIATKAQRH